MVQGAVAVNRAGSSRDRIVFLGHATALIELDGVTLLTDPLLRGRVVHLRRQVSPVEILSEKGGVARIANPWHPDGVTVTALPAGQPVAAEAGGGVIRFETKAGMAYRVSRA